MSAGKPQPTPTLRITSYDFRPQTGSFNAEWPGPPRHRLRYDEVKHYVPSFSVQSSPSARVTLNFWIMEERTFWDAKLGRLIVEFNPGGAITIRYPSSSGSGQAPQGCSGVDDGDLLAGVHRTRQGERQRGAWR